MTEQYGRELQDLFDAADRAIAHSREIIRQRREMLAACENDRRQQEDRFAFRRELWKPR
ncbi:hypothetical protein ACVIW2_005963 [Bradyrhizobium huanghuaihaiense]|nr:MULTISPECIES: hypothetical protein [Bradyrhizobium]